MAKRRAKLEIVHGQFGRLALGPWCRLKGRNGEIQLSGEVVSRPKRCRAAIVRSMIDVLEDEGYIVTKPEGEP